MKIEMQMRNQWKEGKKKRNMRDIHTNVCVLTFKILFFSIIKTMKDLDSYDSEFWASHHKWKVERL